MASKVEYITKIYKHQNDFYQVNDLAEVHARLESDEAYFFTYISNSANGAKVENQEKEFYWDKRNTLLLIEKYANLKDQFRNPKIKKKELWGRIQKEFDIHGYKVNEEMLDRKWRNMKKTFIAVKDNTKKTGRERISWEYYASFNNIYMDDKTVNVPFTISSTIEAKDIPQNVDISETASPTISNCTQLDSALNTSLIESAVLPCSSGKSPNADTQLDSVIESAVLPCSPGKSPSAGAQAKSTRQKGLYYLRKRSVELEEKRIDEIKLLRVALEESNIIQKERNEILKKLIKP